MCMYKFKCIAFLIWAFDKSASKLVSLFLLRNNTKWGGKKDLQSFRHDVENVRQIWITFFVLGRTAVFDKGSPEIKPAHAIWNWRSWGRAYSWIKFVSSELINKQVAYAWINQWLSVKDEREDRIPSFSPQISITHISGSVAGKQHILLHTYFG